MAEDKQKKELIAKIDAAKSQAERLETMGKSISTVARMVIDSAEPTKAFVQNVATNPNNDDQITRLLGGWSDCVVSGAMLESAGLTACNSFGAVAYSTANTTGSAMYVGFDSISDSAEAARKQFANVVAQQQLQGQVRVELLRLGLDRSTGDWASPLELFDQAVAALQNPPKVDATSAAALPLRECVQASLAALLRRRPPPHSPTKKLGDKINELAGKLTYAKIPASVFSRLTTDGERLIDDLSSCKGKVLTRAELQDLFGRGVLYLKALLSSIDDAKLRP